MYKKLTLKNNHYEVIKQSLCGESPAIFNPQQATLHTMIMD